MIPRSPLIALLPVLLHLPVAAVRPSDHPLDALDATEIEAAVALLENAGKTDEKSRYVTVHLREPDKARILSWTAGQAIPRAAAVVVRQGARTFEGVVDLAAREIEGWKEIETSRSLLLDEEIASAARIAAGDERVREALAARGVEDPSVLHCLPMSLGGPAARGRRVRVLCWNGKDRNNVLSRPLGGLEIEADLDERRVVRFFDHGPQPVATADHAYDAATVATRRRLKPFVQEQPAGPSFSLDGASVRWQSWAFHLRLDPRRGLVVSQVRYWDRGRRRPVLYQGSLAEVFVPYALEADGSWLGWTSADRGLRFNSLAAGLDCPPTSTLLHAVFADDRGRPRRLDDALAIFERWTGDPAWRHGAESRPGVELVARVIASLGTTDYVLDWIFTQEGSLRVSVGLTGLMLNHGASTVFLSDETAAADTTSGNLMAANIVAPHHSHRLSFRLDLDVDGPINSFVRDELELVRPEPGRLGLWTVTSHFLRRESQARLNRDPVTSGRWRVLGSDRKTDVGHTPGFTLEGARQDRPGAGRAAALGAYELRVTPHDGALYSPAAGTDRPIEATDLVLWYTLGFDHLPRLEDFPVIPTDVRSFELRPFHFFEKNPAIDLRTGAAPRGR